MKEVAKPNFLKIFSQHRSNQNFSLGYLKHIQRLQALAQKSKIVFSNNFVIIEAKKMQVNIVHVQGYKNV